MSSDAIAAVALFLAGQTGALVWCLASINAKQGDMKDTLKEVQNEARGARLEVAGLPCRTCRYPAEEG